jgi:hypothetical protein
MAMPVASMREYAFGLVKASFHRLHHLLSALSQAIPPSFERKTYKNLIQNKKVITFCCFFIIYRLLFSEGGSSFDQREKNMSYKFEISCAKRNYKL